MVLDEDVGLAVRDFREVGDSHLSQGVFLRNALYSHQRVDQAKLSLRSFTPPFVLPRIGTC